MFKTFPIWQDPQLYNKSHMQSKSISILSISIMSISNMHHRIHKTRLQSLQGRSKMKLIKSYMAKHRVDHAVVHFFLFSRLFGKFEKL